MSIEVLQKDNWWPVGLLLFSLLLEGVALPIAGRTPNLSIFDIALPLLVAYMLLQNLLGDRYWGFPDKSIFVLGLLYLFAQTLSLLFNFGDILRSLVLIKVSTFGLLFYWIVISRTRTRMDLSHTTDCLIAWGAVLGCVLLYRFATDWASLIGPEASYEVKDEVGISIGRSNYLAALMVPILPIALAAITAKPGLKKAIPIAASLVIFAGLLITFSKGAMFALLIGTLVCVPLLVKVGLRFGHLALFLTVSVLFVWALPSDLVASNYDMVLYRLHNPEFGRPDLWLVAWREFLEHPILGIGPNCIYIYNRQYAIDALHTHNFVLNWLAEEGLVGALPFFSAIVLIVRRAYKLCVNPSNIPEARKISVGLFVGLVSTLLHGLVEPTFQGPQYSVIFWCCAAMVFLYDPSRGLFSKSEVAPA